MVLPKAKNEGGLRVRNLDMIVEASLVKKVAGIWEKSSILQIGRRIDMLKTETYKTLKLDQPLAP